MGARVAQGLRRAERGSVRAQGRDSGAGQRSASGPLYRYTSLKAGYPGEETRRTTSIAQSVAAGRRSRPVRRDYFLRSLILRPLKKRGSVGVSVEIHNM